MAKVSSFRDVVLGTEDKFINDMLSETWCVQFVGSPGLTFWTSSTESEELRNVHYVCPYVKGDYGWGVYPYNHKFPVKSFDFETGIVVVNYFGKDVEFHVVRAK